jgi:hypothetical protein
MLVRAAGDATGASDRVLGAIGIRRRPRDITPSLDQYLASKTKNGRKGGRVNGDATLCYNQTPPTSIRSAHEASRLVELAERHCCDRADVLLGADCH